MRERLLGDSLWLGLGQISGQVATALVYILAARSASPSAFGQAASAAAIGLAAFGLLDYGSSVVSLRECAAGRWDPCTYQAWFRSRLLVSCIVAFAMVGVLTVVFNVPPLLATSSAGLMVALLAANGANVRLRAALQMRKLARIQVWSRLAMLPIALGLALLRDDPSWLPAVLALGAILEAVQCVRDGRQGRSHVGTPRRRWMNPWSRSGRVGPSTALISCQQLDVPILTAASGTDASGLYGSVSRWTAFLAVVSNAFSQAAFPRFSDANSFRAAAALLRSGLAHLLVGVLAAGAIVILAPLLVPLILGGSYEGAARALQILAMAVPMSLIAQPLYLLLQSQHREAWALGALAISVPTQLLLVYKFGSQYGAAGAATAVLIGQALGLLLLGLGVLVAYRDGGPMKPLEERL